CQGPPLGHCAPVETYIVTPPWRVVHHRQVLITTHSEAFLHESCQPPEAGGEPSSARVGRWFGGAGLFEVGGAAFGYEEWRQAVTVEFVHNGQPIGQRLRHDRPSGRSGGHVVERDHRETEAGKKPIRIVHR